MRQYFDYFDYIGYFDDDRENRNNTFPETEADEKDGEEEKSPGLIEGEKDPVRIYLKEMSSVPLLTREGEIEIAKKMEDGREKIYRVIFSLPFVLKKLILLGKMVTNGEVSLEGLVQNHEESTEEEMQLERERFSDITREIELLNKKRTTYLKKLKETVTAGRKKTAVKIARKTIPDDSRALIKYLEQNRETDNQQGQGTEIAG